MDTIQLNADGTQAQEPVQENATLTNEQVLANMQAQKEKSKKKHNSALTAALVSRSAVDHVKLKRLSNKPGDFAHSGTNISYEY